MLVSLSVILNVWPEGMCTLEGEREKVSDPDARALELNIAIGAATNSSSKSEIKEIA